VNSRYRLLNPKGLVTREKVPPRKKKTGVRSGKTGYPVTGGGKNRFKPVLTGGFLPGGVTPPRFF